MTEAFNPEARVDATGLLAITPDKIILGPTAQLGMQSYLQAARHILRYRPTEDEIPLGELPAGHDPMGDWSLTAEGEQQAAAEADAFVAASNFAAETATLAAKAFPDDPHLQTIAIHNATSMLHHAARGFLVLPRRQIYHEFAKERRIILMHRLGQTAAAQVLHGGEPKVRTATYLYASAELRQIRPQRELLDLTTVPQEETSPVMQEVIGDTAMLARLLLRHAPSYFTDQTTWAQGAAGLARRALEKNPWDLWQALLDAPGQPAETLIGLYLERHKYLSSYMTEIGDGPAYDPQWRRRQARRRTQEVQSELDELVTREGVKPEILTATTGDVINLTERGVQISKATFTRLLNDNLRTLGCQQYLDSVVLREATRSRMPEFSDHWTSGAKGPAETVLGKHYGNVRNARIVFLPVDETLRATKYKLAEQIDFSRLVRMAVLVDYRSSAARAGNAPLTHVAEVTVYPNHSTYRDLITRETRGIKKTGEDAVVALWHESALRAYDLEVKMRRHAFIVGPPGSGKQGGSRG